MKTLLRTCCHRARPLLGSQSLNRASVLTSPPGWLSARRVLARRQLSVQSEGVPTHDIVSEHGDEKLLPWSCPGCGAFTQLTDRNGAGYYSTSRKSVKAFIEPSTVPESAPTSSEAPAADGERDQDGPPSKASTVPVCDRCHDLLHHNKGSSVEHPTMDAIQAIFGETPHKHNHIYHVLDAADFPMSLIPRLHEKLDLSPQRSQNRRSKHAKYLQGRVAEISFIITRSDLLAPRKEQVDAMMPTLVAILRRALGRAGRDIRLGNVKCVSANRGWWTPDVKETIWKRGGGGWMVGKVNVGKSKLFESILPKGRMTSDARPDHTDDPPSGYDRIRARYNDAEPSGLLPPRTPDTNFPALPVVSSLSGTTAGPIRVPFGQGRGELIDLPGLARGGLEDLVEEEHRQSLIMTDRVKPKQVTIKPGQSLVISNLIRITPKTEKLVFLASPFVALDHHVCSTERAVQILAQERNHVLTGVAKAEAVDKISSAGTVKLQWDVTRQRAGPLTAKDAVALDPGRLPFVVLATDLLIEGVGWVEIACQMRRRELEEIERRPGFVEGDQYPEIEVFSPDGKHVGRRQTLNAWLQGGQRKPPASRRKARPRRSMKGQKKAAKRQRRSEEAAVGGR